MIDLWSARFNSEASDEEDFFSCSDEDSDSSDEEFFTPPQSPRPFDSDDDDIMAFEESLDNFDEEKGFSLFIEG